MFNALTWRIGAVMAVTGRVSFSLAAVLRSSYSVDSLTQCYVLIHVLWNVELGEPDGSNEAAKGYCGELGVANHSDSTVCIIVAQMWDCAQRTMEPRRRVMEKQ